MTTRRRRSPARPLGLLAALAISAGALMHGFPAQADELGVEPPRVDLVLDVSGSMRATDIQGKSRMEVAQKSINEVIDALPEETHFGIRTLGATYPGNDKNEGCKDTKQLFPVGKTDKTQAKTAVATLRPTGWTPIGLALRGAAQDVGTGSTTRRIVLITDGEDSCAPPDPCEVARELAAAGTHLVVDTLGLAHDEKTRQQLLCIANATGGTFTDVQTQQQLTDKVKQLVKRAGTTNRTAPAKATGTEQCDTAPVLAPRRLQRPGEVLRAPGLPRRGPPGPGAPRLRLALARPGTGPGLRRAAQGHRHRRPGAGPRHADAGLRRPHTLTCLRTRVCWSLPVKNAWRQSGGLHGSRGGGASRLPGRGGGGVEGVSSRCGRSSIHEVMLSRACESARRYR
ncbi:hypothetical protein GCM10020229_56780 [Kitasatospora albolonga]